jgi:predicted Zn-dependent protease
MHGLVQTEQTIEVVRNDSGLLAAQCRPSCWVVVLALTGSGSSGYREQRSLNLDGIDSSTLAHEARAVAVAGRDPHPIEPGRYRVVLGELAVADLLAKTARLTFSAAAVAAGTSAFQRGHRVAARAVTVTDDGVDPAGVPSAFDAEGVARRPVTLIKGGRCVEVVHDAGTAAASGAVSTGHALPRPDSVGPLARNLFLAPGRRSRAELIADVEDGLLIERLYYTNPLDPRRVVMTGSTRDGVFRIRHGELAEAVVDQRFQQSYLELLANIVEVGGPRRTVSGWYGGVNVLGDVTVPVAAVDGFRVG